MNPLVMDKILTMLANSETIFRIRAFHELLKVFPKADGFMCKHVKLFLQTSVDATLFPHLLPPLYLQREFIYSIFYLGSEMLLILPMH